MSQPLHRAARAGSILAVGLAFTVAPLAASAAPVNLATVSPFVVLGGAAVTNTGPSVLNGALGVAPGTSLVGFDLPAVVNGAIHANNAVAAQAQADLTTAYDVAAAQPVPAANDLTGTDLGNRTLAAGAYRFTSSAQLTGALTLDAAGDPNAQFVFDIASTLVTAPASSVNLVNGASPCNVFWQVGSSATLDTTTAFQGNLMALSSISVNNGATVIGRLLARNGQISLINNVISNSGCSTPETTTSSTPTQTAPTTTSGTPGTSTTATTSTPVTSGRAPSGGGTGRGTAVLRLAPVGPAPGRAGATRAITARVRGAQIERVVFRLDGRRIASRTGSPFDVVVRAGPGTHRITARVTFKDGTPGRTLTSTHRVRRVVVIRPPRGPSQFTG